MTLATRIRMAATVLFHEPAPTHSVAMDMPMRSPATGQFTLSPKELARLNRRAAINCELAVYKATTTHQQRFAEAAAFFAVSEALHDGERVKL